MKRIILIFLVTVYILTGLIKTASASEKETPGNKSDTAFFKSLKAILVVGSQEDGTASAIESMNEIADFLISKGVIVYRFYGDTAQWDKIKTVASNANFFIYSGHGARLGGEGKAGGLCLTEMISSKQIIDELKLHKNAMVVFKSVCNGAGSSADDDGDITINEAVKRVTDYSRPFFDIGASCYYANNLGGGCLKYLNNFFSGKSVKICYEESTETWAEIEWSKVYQYNVNMQISIASTNWGVTATRTTYINGVKTVEEVPASKEYSIAYVANPDFTIYDMIK
jgi:hypothetical protein